MGLAVIGVGNISAEHGWTRLISIPFGVAGAALIVSGVRSSLAERRDGRDDRNGWGT
jgi:hypothetical protein